MPRATTAYVEERDHLRRNEACHQCRRRKLKCDAMRPCTGCRRHHANIIAARAMRGESFVNHPTCTYDKPRGSPDTSQSQSNSAGRFNSPIHANDTVPPTPCAVISSISSSDHSDVAWNETLPHGHLPSDLSSFTAQGGVRNVQHYSGIAIPVSSTFSTNFSRAASLQEAAPSSSTASSLSPEPPASSPPTSTHYLGGGVDLASQGACVDPFPSHRHHSPAAWTRGPQAVTNMPVYSNGQPLSSFFSKPAYAIQQGTFAHETNLHGNSLYPMLSSEAARDQVYREEIPFLDSDQQKQQQQQYRLLLPTLLQTGESWLPNLPWRGFLLHLVHTFFITQPLAPYLLHRPSFMHSLSHGTQDTRFPSIALLHAICAMAGTHVHPHNLNLNGLSPLTSNVVGERGDIGGGCGAPPGGCPMSASGSAKEHALSSGITVEPSVADNGSVSGSGGGSPDPQCTHTLLVSFSEEQATFAQSVLEADFRCSKRMLECVQTAIILAWYYHVNARWMEARLCSELALRGCLPINLHTDYDGVLVDSWGNRSMTRERAGPEYFEQRRAVFWIAFMMDSFQCVSTSWPSALAEEDVSQTFPCRLIDYEASKEISQPRQHLRSSTLFSYNDSSVTDSFILHLKATILIGRAAKFSSRLKVRFDRPAENHELRYFRALPEFAEIEASILTFQANIPGGLKQFMSDPPGGGEKPHNPYSDIIDHNMYLAYIVSYMARIVLHDPCTDLSDPNDISARTILESANAILDSIRAISDTSLDFSTMYHGTSMYWIKTAAVFIRYLEYELVTGNLEGAAGYKSDIRTIQTALQRMGKRCPVARAHMKTVREWVEAAIAAANNA